MENNVAHVDGRNIILVGMPGSGKTTIGKILASVLGRKFYDTDEMIEKRTHLSVTDLFSKYGEKVFRTWESEMLYELEGQTGLVIATGGGAILRNKNVNHMRNNGIICFLDRPVEQLIAAILSDHNRPLSKTEKDIRRQYSERYDQYIEAAHICVKVTQPPKIVANNILGEWMKL